MFKLSTSYTQIHIIHLYHLIQSRLPLKLLNEYELKYSINTSVIINEGGICTYLEIANFQWRVILGRVYTASRESRD